jgi:acetoacetyl-CoA synthetase
MEVPVRRILLGMPPEDAANVNAMRNPGSLAEFVSYARTQRDYSLNPAPRAGPG